jgi:hypothetical protein
MKYQGTPGYKRLVVVPDLELVSLVEEDVIPSWLWIAVGHCIVERGNGIVLVAIELVTEIP